MQYDILDLAKATGQRPSSPKAIKADSSDTEDGEGDDEADHQNGAAPAKPKRRRVSPISLLNAPPFLTRTCL
jgi:hypothetical protein